MKTVPNRALAQAFGEQVQAGDVSGLPALERSSVASSLLLSWSAATVACTDAAGCAAGACTKPFSLAQSLFAGRSNVTNSEQTS